MIPWLKKTILYTLCLVVVLGCKEKTPIPSNIMDTATMVRFLTEAHLIESYDYVVVQQHRDSLASQSTAAMDSLFAKYGITEADYDSSLNYYLKNPQMLETIYERVVQNLKNNVENTPLSNDTLDLTRKKITLFNS